MHPTHNPPTTAGDDTPAQILRDAALYLERHGWIQGEFYTAATAITPPACAVGAIRCAMLGAPTPVVTNDHKDAVDRVVDVLALHVDDAADDPDTIVYSPTAVVTDWNDTHGRTADEVITTLRGAADHWDNTHGGAR